MKIVSGNLNEKIKESPEKRGWFIGYFMDTDSFFKNDDFEVKWAVHSKREKKLGAIIKNSAKTIVILIKGEFVVRFPYIKREVILSQVGDFVSFNANKIKHDGEALKDSIVLVIRWPSYRKINKV